MFQVEQEFVVLATHLSPVFLVALVGFEDFHEHFLEFALEPTVTLVLCVQRYVAIARNLFAY